MENLPNGCSRSELSVYPANWETGGKDLLKKIWYIDYRFRDPSRQDQYPNGYQKRIKSGINRLSTLEGRRENIKLLLSQEISMLNQGYNPITGLLPQVREGIYDKMPFIAALRAAMESIKCVATTKIDLKSVIKYTEQAAVQLGYDRLCIEEVTRRHMKIILDQLAILKGEKWTDNNYNYYRAHWIMLFNELCQYDAVSFNFITSIKKRATLESEPLILSKDQRIEIDKHLRETNFRFWIVVNLFFHSGVRRTELRMLRGADVDLTNLTYKALVKKRKKPTIVSRPIKRISLPFWEMALSNCGPNQYVFSDGLMPGDKPIRAEQFTRRWKTHVKDHFYDKWGVVPDFYKLKALNSDEIAEIASLEAAALLNSHQSTKTTLDFYAPGEKRRREEALKNQIKGLGNSFA